MGVLDRFGSGSDEEDSNNDDEEEEDTVTIVGHKTDRSRPQLGHVKLAVDRKG